MRAFDEEVGPKGKQSKEIVVILNFDEAHKIVQAMEEYCKMHPREKNAKKLLKEMDNKFGIYDGRQR